MKIDHTLELVAALHALSLRHKQNLADDGRESRWELIGYLHEFRPIKRALEGIKDVPAELIDLADDEVPGLVNAMSEVLRDWGVSFRQQDITAEVVRAIVDAVPVIKEVARRWEKIVNLPPTAEAA